jgi:hypothetical protein
MRLALAAGNRGTSVAGEGFGPVGRKIEIGSVMQLCDKRDAALPALASRPQCRSGDPVLSEPMRKGLADLSSDAGAIG